VEIVTILESTAESRTAQEKTAIERQTAATDKTDETLRRTQGDTGGRIEELVHELYRLTEEENRIAEAERR